MEEIVMALLIALAIFAAFKLTLLGFVVVSALLIIATLVLWIVTGEMGKLLAFVPVVFLIVLWFVGFFIHVGELLGSAVKLFHDLKLIH